MSVTDEQTRTEDVNEGQDSGAAKDEKPMWGESSVSPIADSVKVPEPAEPAPAESGSH